MLALRRPGAIKPCPLSRLSHPWEKKKRLFVGYGGNNLPLIHFVGTKHMKYGTLDNEIRCFTRGKVDR